MVLRLGCLLRIDLLLSISISLSTALPLFNYNFVNISGYYIFTLAS